MAAPMVALYQATLLSGTENVSSYTIIILIVSLYRRVLDHLHVSSYPGNGFWDRHYEIVEAQNDCRTRLLGHLHTQVLREDALTFALHMNIFAIEICLQKVAIAEADRENLPKPFAVGSRKRSEVAARRWSVSSGLIGHYDDPRMFFFPQIMLSEVLMI